MKHADDDVTRPGLPSLLMVVAVITGIAGLVGGALILTGFLTRTGDDPSILGTTETSAEERRRAEERLLSYVPADVRPHCSRRTVQPVKASVASLQCAPPGFKGEYEGVDYDLFADLATLDEAFALQSDNPELSFRCSGIRQQQGRYSADGGPSGRIACLRGRGANQGFIWINWTQESDLVLGQAFTDNSPFRVIARWWTRHVDRATP